MFKAIVFIVCAVAYISAGCPEGAKPFGSKCYQFINTDGNVRYSEAYVGCGQLYGYLKGNLTSIHDLSENTFIQSSTTFNGTFADIWIGGRNYDIFHRGEWGWADMSDFSWTNWEIQSSVNDTKFSRCISMDLLTGFWFSSNCSERKPFVCEVSNTYNATTSTSSPTTAATKTNYDTAHTCANKIGARLIDLCNNNFIPPSEANWPEIQLLEKKCCNTRCSKDYLKKLFCASH